MTLSRLIAHGTCVTFAICFAGRALAQDNETAKRAVVKITSQAEGQSREGTGFVVKLKGEDVYIVTASHVIEGDSKPRVYFFTEPAQPHGATIVGTEGDLPRGLALIQVHGRPPAGISRLGIDASFKLAPGETVTVIGFPRLANTPWAVTSAFIVGRQGTAITFTGAVDEGSSGSPMLRNGWVTALVIEKSGEFGYAVPAASVLFAIEGWGVNVQDDLGTHRSPSPSISGRSLANTKIAFQSDRDEGIKAMYTMDTDGRNVKRIGETTGDQLSWSPDGARAAYVVDDDVHTMGIYLIEVASGKSHRLTQAMAFYFLPCWSPDGKKVAYLANTSISKDLLDVFLINVDGTGNKRLTHRSSNIVGLFWSPDGNKIGFSEVGEKGGKTFFMNPDGSELEQLSSPLINFYGGGWSPDGTRILGISIQDNHQVICVVNVDGSDPRRLTDPSSENTDPVWSPDGTKIAFASNRDGNREIYVMNSDGSNPVRLTVSKGKNWNPQWSPFLK